MLASQLSTACGAPIAAPRPATASGCCAAGARPSTPSARPAVVCQAEPPRRTVSGGAGRKTRAGEAAPAGASTAASAAAKTVASRRRTQRSPRTEEDGEESPSASASASQQNYFQPMLLGGLPLGPFFSRPTVRSTLVPNVMWSFEQPQSLANVTVNIRMTVVRLASGGLFIYAPVAPTPECRAMLQELGGEVEIIVLPTFAVEHKVYLGPFARCYPAARVFAAPGQWSFPLNLPLKLLGGVAAEATIVDGPPPAAVGPDWPWAGEMEHRVYKASVGVGPYTEVLFYHKPSKTLLVTDCLISVPAEPLAIVAAAAPQNLLLSAREPAAPAAAVADTAANRRKGWMRMVLQVCFFNPSDLVSGYAATFGKLADRLMVLPVLQTFVFGKVPTSTMAFVDEVCRWPFVRIVPCHFTAPIAAGPAELRAAFAAVYEKPPADGAEGSGDGADGDAASSGDGGGLAGLLSRALGGLLPGGGGGAAGGAGAALRLLGGRTRAGVGPATMAADMATLRALNGFLVKAGIADEVSE